MRIAKYAKALEALAKAGLLADEDCKEPVKDFIRRASETSQYHATTHFRSKEVATIMRKQMKNVVQQASRYHDYCSKHFSHEHVVPCEVIYQMIIKLKTADQFEAVFRKYAIRATITKNQNKRLNRLFRYKMPDVFWDPSHVLFQDPFARYKVKEVDIYDELEKRGDAHWI